MAVLIVLLLIPVFFCLPAFVTATIWWFARDSIASVFSWPFASTITFEQAFWVSFVAYIIIGALSKLFGLKQVVINRDRW
jgi:hypothetical protein